MPSELTINIYQAKNLPIMEKNRNTTDAYVIVKFGDTIKKTETKNNTLNPFWGWKYSIESIDDNKLQDNCI